MAKNEKKTISIADVNTANLDEKLKDANKMDQEILDMATEKMDKEEKERKADQLMRAIKKANYQNMRCHIDFKYMEDAAEAEKDVLKKTKESLENLMAGKITVEEYKDSVNEMCKEAGKKIDDAGEKRRKRIAELQSKYGEWYGLSWDDPFLRLSRKIRDNS